MKFRLDSSSSDTIKFLDLLHFHLNIYQKPDQDNLKSIIDSFVKILIGAIDHNIDVLTNLYNYYNLIYVYFNYLFDNIKNFYLYHLNEILFDKLYDVPPYYIKSKFIDKLFDIKSYIHKLYPYRNRNISFVLNNIKTIKRIKDETLSKLRDELIKIKTEQPDYITQIKNKLEGHYSDDFHSYHLNNIDKLAAIISAPTNLANLRENLRDIRNDFVYFKNEANNIREELDYLKNSVFFKQYAMWKFSKCPGFDSLMKSFKNDEKKFQSNKANLEKLYPHVLDTIKNIDYLIKEIKLIIEIIPNVRQKLLNAKSKLDKGKLIQYIINLIDTINLIISVETSEIVDHLKKIYPIKKELESIITSIKVKEIESDIKNLRNLYSNMLDINLFSTNIQKLKGYISSVECHLRGIDSISNSFNNIQNLIDSKYLKLISSDLVLDYYKLSQPEPKLNEIVPLKNYMDEMKNYIFILNYLVGMINKNINKIVPLVNEFKKSVEFINSQIKCLKSDISELECAIDGVFINLIRCSVLSPRKGIIIINFTDLRVNEVKFDMCDI